jgi:hypothetical protein
MVIGRQRKIWVGVSEIQMLGMFYLIADNEMLKRILNLKSGMTS